MTNYGNASVGARAYNRGSGGIAPSRD